jgi:hypothetical protein
MQPSNSALKLINRKCMLVEYSELPEAFTVNCEILLTKLFLFIYCIQKALASWFGCNQSVCEFSKANAITFIKEYNNPSNLKYYR